MKFSQNGYYIEKYVKCTNCGVLIYDSGAPAKYLKGDLDTPYCTEWCVEWATQKQKGIDDPSISGSFEK